MKVIYLPVEHATAKDKLVHKAKRAFKTQPLSAGALLNDRVAPGSMLWDTLCYGLFPLEEEMKASMFLCNEGFAVCTSRSVA